MSEPFFENEVKTKWIHSGDSRKMILLEDFAFVDKDTYRWEAPAGSEIDGASIPSFLWSAVGSPYVGNFRRASVVHDVACFRKTESSKAVHKMFYEAMLVDGVPIGKAQQMYTAVRLFGPTWRLGSAAESVVDSTRSLENDDLGIDFEQLESVIDAVLGE